MCLNSRNSDEVTRNLLPDGEFFAYKLLRKSGDTLCSPHYTTVWRPGEMISRDAARGNNGDVGIYVFMANPGPGVMLDSRGSGWSNKQGGNRLVQVRVKPEDVVASGKDTWNGFSGTTLVVRKLTITQEDYDLAMNDSLRQIKIDQLLVEAKEGAKQTKEVVAERKEQEAKHDEEARPLAQKTKAVVAENLKTELDTLAREDEEVAKQTKDVKAKVKKKAKSPAKKKESKAVKAAVKKAKTKAKTPKKAAPKKAAKPTKSVKAAVKKAKAVAKSPKTNKAKIDVSETIKKAKKAAKKSR